MRGFRTVIVASMLTLSLVMSASAGLSESLTASGEWKSLSSEAIGGRWTVALVREGEEVRGQLTLTGSNEFTGGEVRGTMDQSNIMLGVLEEGAKQATFSGRMDGDRISGEWSSDLVKDQGVWFGVVARQGE